ncbi:MAG: hypothetical protein QF915_01590, partial [Candidatus Woesearchaeota archaeon]|nr:hypothetical protein [Candidatus Woesearchaeota archaeon]
MTKRILLIFVCLLLISPVLAEKQQEPDFYNKGATRTLNPTTKTTLLQSLFSPQSTTQQVLAAQNLDRDDLTLTKIQSIDPLYKYQPKGITHTSYKQIYQDIPVFNSYVGYTEINGKPTLLKTKYY